MNRFLFKKKKVDPDNPIEKKVSKRRNIDCEYNDIKFKSKKEMNYYKELLIMEKAGLVTDLELQPHFLLQEGFRDKNGKKHIRIEYIADYKYKDIKTNTEWIIDVKASPKFLDPVYKLKKKLLLFKYPDINFLEIFTVNIKAK